MMKAFIINGSPRKNGNTAYICSSITGLLEKQGHDAEVLGLHQIVFSTCRGCEKCRKDKICTGLNDELTQYYEPLLASRLWVLASPVHNYNVTALMKAFLDRLYCFYDFTDDRPRRFHGRLSDSGIRAVLVGVGEQLSREDFGFTMEAMEKPLVALGVKVIESFRFYGHFEPGSLKKDVSRIESFKKDFNAAINTLVE